MSRHTDLSTAERSLNELVRAVGRLEQQVGGGLEIRRVRSDTDHLGESLRLLKESVSSAPPVRAGEQVAMVPVPDTPYDASLWADAEDEGLGAKDRRAP